MIEYASDPVRVGNVIIGGGNPIVVQTMCNTHTSDVGASFKQCLRLFQAGAQMIRLTVPSMAQVANISEIRRRLSPEKNNIDCIRGCYVDEKGESIFKSFPDIDWNKLVG